MDKLKGVIWDWDGTLVKESASLWDSMRSCGRDLINTKFLELGEKIFSIEDEVRRCIRENFKKDPDKYLIKGARECVESLGEVGVPQAIGTNNYDSHVREMLVSAGFEKHIKVVVGRESVVKNETKPHPKTFLKCVDGLGLSKEDIAGCVVVGNTKKDMIGAKSAGILARVGLSTGCFGIREDLREAVRVYPDLSSLNSGVLEELVLNCVTKKSH